MTGCSAVPNKVFLLLRTLSKTSALAVYLHLAAEHGYESPFDLSMRRLSNELSKSRPTIVEALGVLEELELIEVTQKGQGMTAHVKITGAVCGGCTVTCHKTCKARDAVEKQTCKARDAVEKPLVDAGTGKESDAVPKQHVKNETQLAPVALWEEPQVDGGTGKESDAVSPAERTYLLGSKVLGSKVSRSKVLRSKVLYTDGRPLEIWNKWNAEKVTVHKFITAKQEDAIRKTLAELDRHLSEDESLAEVLKAIENYAECCHRPQYRWSHKWPLDEFLKRGFDRFRDEADPLTRELYDDKSRPHQDFTASRGAAAFDGL